MQKWLWNSSGKRYRHCAKYGCETLRVSAISRSGYVYPGKLKRPPFPSGVRIPDVKYPDGMSAKKNSGCETSGWNVGGNRISDVIHPGHWLKCTSLAMSFQQPAHTPCILILLMAKDFKASVSSCFWAFHCFAMGSKELSSILDCFGDQITNKKHQNLHNLIKNDCKGP